MKKVFFSILFLVAMSHAFAQGTFKNGKGGMLYIIHEDKPGIPVKEGDFISVNLVAKTDRDSVLFNSYDTGKPVPTLLPKPQFKGDVYAGMYLLSEGDSATIKVNADSMFKVSPKPAGFKGKFITYEVRVVKVIYKGKLTDKEFQSLVGDYFKIEGDRFKFAEPVKINRYIADSKRNFTKTASGMYYAINQPGTGNRLVKGDTAVINYTGKNITGKTFDTTFEDIAKSSKIYEQGRRYQPIRVPVGAGTVIPGWDEGLLLLNKGAKATMVIPSSLAYGEKGLGPVPPYSPIIFEMELVNIVHPRRVHSVKTASKRSPVKSTIKKH